MKSEIEQLKNKMNSTEYGCDEYFSYLDEAIRLAEIINDKEELKELYEEMLDVGYFYGRTLSAIIAFSWLIKYAEETGDGEADYMWRYKSILTSLPSYDHIDFKTIYGFIDDYKVKLLKNGFSLHSYYSRLISVNISCGNNDNDEIYSAMKKSRKDENSECEGCLVDLDIDYYISKNDYQKAKKAADFLFTNKSIHCNRTPFATYATMCVKAFLNGDKENALKYANNGIKYITDESGYVSEISNFIMYYALSGDMKKAMAMYKKYLPWSLKKQITPAEFANFSSATYILFALLNKTNPQFMITLTPEFELYNHNNKYISSVLADYYKKYAIDLCLRFDKRNNNNYRSTLLNDYIQAAGL